jgi:hypothetical protein
MSLTAIRLATLALGLGIVAAAPAVAEPANDQGGRFTMSPVEGGFIRLDKQTGSVAMCAKSASGWACTPIEDRTADAPGNAAQSEAEIRALKERVRELEALLETRPPGGRPDGPFAGDPAQLPSEAEVDQALDYMSRVYKKIRDHIRDLDKPMPPGEQYLPPPGAPVPPPAAPSPRGSL